MRPNRLQNLVQHSIAPCFRYALLLAAAPAAVLLISVPLAAAMAEPVGLDRAIERLASELSTDQLAAFAAGADPETIVLDGGRTLADRLESLLTTGRALDFVAGDSCSLFRTVVAPDGKMIADETRGFIARGDGDLSGQGGAGAGCGIAEEAMAVALSITVSQVDSGGRLKGWASGEVVPDGDLLVYQATPIDLQFSSFAVVGLCAAEPCTSDFEIQTVGAGAHVRAEVAGYFVPAASGDVTSVAAGRGLSGGGDEGDLALSIAPLGVGEGELARSAVTTVKLADGAVTSAKLAAAAVTSTKIADGAVSSAAIADGSITGSDIAPDTIIGPLVLDESLTTDDLADESGINRTARQSAIVPAGAEMIVGRVSIAPPGPGSILVLVEAEVTHPAIDPSIADTCSLTNGTQIDSTYEVLVFREHSVGQLTAMRSFSSNGTDELEFNLVCEANPTGGISIPIDIREMVAIYFASGYPVLR